MARPSARGQPRGWPKDRRRRTRRNLSSARRAASLRLEELVAGEPVATLPARRPARTGAVHPGGPPRTLVLMSHKRNSFHLKTFSPTACRLDKLHTCNSRAQCVRHTRVTGGFEEAGSGHGDRPPGPSEPQKSRDEKKGPAPLGGWGGTYVRCPIGRLGHVASTRNGPAGHEIPPDLSSCEPGYATTGPPGHWAAGRRTGARHPDGPARWGPVG